MLCYHQVVVEGGIANGKLLVGDRFVTVNGQRLSPQDLSKLLGTEQMLSLRVSRKGDSPTRKILFFAEPPQAKLVETIVKAMCEAAGVEWELFEVCHDTHLKEHVATLNVAHYDGRSLMYYISIRRNIWIRDVFLLFSSDPSTLVAGSQRPQPKTRLESRFCNKEVSPSILL